MSPNDEFIDLPGRRPNGGPLRLHYRDWGGEGRPVVLLHGLASNARIWDLTAPHLSDGFRVIAPDQRGHGLSDKPDDGYTLEDVTGDLAALIEALTLDRPLIVGHSWGGNVALQFAADRPDRLCAVVLVDGGFLEISAVQGMTWERAQQVMAPPPLDGMKLNSFLKTARNWPELGPIWNDQVKEIVLANFQVRSDGTIRRRLTIDNHMQILRSLWEQRPSQMWEGLRCPALLIPAARDNPDPGRAMWMDAKRKAIAVALERSSAVQVLWMEDTIHDVPLQRPRELAEAVAEFAAALP